jgi:hypothetical protein
MTASPSLATVALRTVDFGTALNAVAAGKKIARMEWENKEEYGFLRATILHIFRDGAEHVWRVNDGDILATDWVILG